MENRTALSGALSRATKLFMLTAAISLLGAPPVQRSALAAGAPNFAAILPEFNRICSDLGRAREELRLCTIDD